MPHVHLVTSSGVVLGSFCHRHRPIVFPATGTVLRPCDADCADRGPGDQTRVSVCVTCAKLQRVGAPFEC